MIESEWNFASLAKRKRPNRPPRNAKAKSAAAAAQPAAGRHAFTDPLVPKICLWEYARECGPLITQIRSFKDTVAGHYGLSDEQEIAFEAYAWAPGRKYGGLPSRRFKQGIDPQMVPFVEKVIHHCDAINQIAGRFNWGLFCSHEFPAMPWLEEGSRCPIRRVHEIWRSRGHSPHLPRLGRVAGDLQQMFGEDLSQRGEDFVNEIAEFVRSQFPDEVASRFHAFIIPADYFELYSTGDIADALKKQLVLLDRRKLKPNSDIIEQRHRDQAWVWLQQLGIMRLLHGYSPDELREVVNPLSDEDRKTMKVRGKDLRRMREDRDGARKAFRFLFNLLAPELPLNWRRWTQDMTD